MLDALEHGVFDKMTIWDTSKPSPPGYDTWSEERQIQHARENPPDLVVSYTREHGMVVHDQEAFDRIKHRASKAARIVRKWKQAKKRNA